MTVLFLAAVALLALVDAGFAGYRDAAGRDGRVFKDDFYRRALRRGLGLGLRVVILSGLWGMLLVGTAPDRPLALAHLVSAFTPAISVAGVYGALVLLALAVWGIAETDLRSLSSILVLGPFTLLRPLVIVAMLAVGLWFAADVRTGLALALPCLLQLGLEPWLGRAWARGERPCG